MHTSRSIFTVTIAIAIAATGGCPSPPRPTIRPARIAPATPPRLTKPPGMGLQWLKTLSVSSNREVTGTGIASASDGSFYVTGRIEYSEEHDPPKEGEIPSGKLFLIRCNAVGAILWKKQFAGTGMSNQAAAPRILALSDGSVVVVRHSLSSSKLTKEMTAPGATVVSVDVSDVIERYAPDGELLWRRAGYSHDVGAVAARSDDSMVIVYQVKRAGSFTRPTVWDTHFALHDSSGKTLTDRVVSKAKRQIGAAVIPLEDRSFVVVTAPICAGSKPPYEGIVARFKPDGTLSWKRRYFAYNHNLFSENHAVAAARERDDGVVVASRCIGPVELEGHNARQKLPPRKDSDLTWDEVPFDLCTWSYDRRGHLRWARRHHSLGNIYITGATVTPSRQIWIGGRFSQPRGQWFGALFRHNQNGMPIGEGLYGCSLNGVTSLEAVANSSNGSILVLGGAEEEKPPSRNSPSSGRCPGAPSVHSEQELMPVVARLVERPAKSSNAAKTMSTAGDSAAREPSPKAVAHNRRTVLEVQTLTRGGKAFGDRGVESLRCAQSDYCKAGGLCHFVGNGCLAKTDADCRQALECAKNGLCSARGGLCFSTLDADCRRSRACTALGKCVAAGGSCIIRNTDDCRRAAVCTRQGKCLAQYGTCLHKPVEQEMEQLTGRIAALTKKLEASKDLDKRGQLKLKIRAAQDRLFKLRSLVKNKTR